jgi:enamine deaminase RidA (YjgF/YER057c/UK114 family)
MDRPVSSPHELVNSEALAPPIGFSHAVAAEPGRLVFVGGQTAHGPDGTVQGETVPVQFEAAVANLVVALEAAGARPEHLVSVQIFVTDAEAYRASLGPVGQSWRRHFGKHYPAMALFEVKGLFDPGALVELVAIAVVPEGATDTARGR